MKTEITVTRWNIGVLAGWFSVVVGIIGIMLHIYMNIEYGIWFSVVGIIAGGLAITFGGSVKTITKKIVDLKPAKIGDSE